MGTLLPGSSSHRRAGQGVRPRSRATKRTSMLRIAVTNSAQNSQLDHPAGPLEFGRGPQRYLPRCIIQDNFVSRDHLRVEELPGGRVRLYNLSSKSEVGFPDGTCIEPGQITERNLPLQLIVGETILDISLGDKGAAAARPATPPPARPAAGIAETQPLEGMQSALRSRQGQMPDPASLPFGA